MSTNERIKALSQRELLQELKAVKSATRDQLAHMIGGTRRQLDAWMLPDDSKQRRAMDRFMRQQLEVFLQSHEEQEQMKKDGLLLLQGDESSGYTSPISGVTYPVIYQADVQELEFDRVPYINEQGQRFGFTFENVKPTGKIIRNHEFSTASNQLADSEGYRSRYVAVECLGEGCNYWLSVVQIKSMSEWGGFISAWLSSPEFLSREADGPELVQTKHGLFVCTKRNGEQTNTQLFNGMIVYMARYEKIHPLYPDFDEDSEMVVVLPNGEVIMGDKGESYLSAIYGKEDDQSCTFI